MRFKCVTGIPIQKTRLLEQSLVYTGITRATDLAVMVGASETLQHALERDAMPSGGRRRWGPCSAKAADFPVDLAQPRGDFGPP